MRHTVEIADSKGKTMQLTVSVETVGWGGSWRALDKGCIRHNSGAISQTKTSGLTESAINLLQADNTWGVRLLGFVSFLGTVNDQGTGTLVQAWAVSLEPGDIEWSIV